jgi:hypothetical protein
MTWTSPVANWERAQTWLGCFISTGLQVSLGHLGCGQLLLAESRNFQYGSTRLAARLALSSILMEPQLLGGKLSSETARDDTTGPSSRNYRVRSINGDFGVVDVAAGIVPLRINTGKVFMDQLSTDITLGGNNAPNVKIDVVTGELKRVGYSKPTVAAPATNAATTQALVNQLRAALINYGIVI